MRAVSRKTEEECAVRGKPHLSCACRGRATRERYRPRRHRQAPRSVHGHAVDRSPPRHASAPSPSGRLRPRPTRCRRDHQEGAALRTGATGASQRSRLMPRCEMQLAAPAHAGWRTPEATKAWHRGRTVKSSVSTVDYVKSGVTVVTAAGILTSMPSSRLLTITVREDGRSLELLTRCGGVWR